MTRSSNARLGWAALGLLLLAWLAASLVTIILLTILVVPGHLGFDQSLRGWEGQLPDPATFPQNAARLRLLAGP